MWPGLPPALTFASVRILLTVRLILTGVHDVSEVNDPLLQWAQQEGARLSPAFDGGTEDLGPLRLLDEDISRADLVFLGELDHFIHEKSDARLLFCRYLIDRGWRSFAEELSWSDGLRVQHFLRDQGDLDRLALFGWSGDLRKDRDDRPTGIFRPSFDLYPTDLMAAEQARFYSGLKAAAGEVPVAYHGFDIDAAPGGGYADILREMSTDAGLFHRALSRVPGETLGEEAGRLAALVPSAPSLEIAASLRATAESLRYVEMTYSAETYEATAPGIAYREGCMKRRFDDIRSLTGNAPMVLMGHGLHLAKDDLLGRELAGVGPGGGIECSLGHHLVQDRHFKAVSIWFVHGAGEDSQPFPGLPRRFDYPANTLNRRLAPLGAPTLIPITGAPSGLFDRPLGVGGMYNSVQQATLQGQVDAILYLPRVTPMRL